MCGLTEEEVMQAIEMAGIEGEKKEETFNKMKANYEGYRFSKFDDEHLFNTTLVMYYLRDLVQIGRPPENLVDGNLAATGSKIENMAGLINKDENYEILNELLLNGEITSNLTESFELDKRFTKNDFVSMLFYNGYVTIKELDGMELKFGIPNFVTQILYADYFLELTDLADKYRIDTSTIEKAIVELKYIKEKERKKANIKSLTKQAKAQLANYLIDKRMEQKEILKKFVVIFKGFEDYYIEEI